MPFRKVGDRLEVCLITSRVLGLWGIPKGTVEKGEKPKACALRESWEEAGLFGQIVGKSVGSWSYVKKRLRHRVKLFLMEVERLDDDYPELGQRQRRWVPVSELPDWIERVTLLRMVEGAVGRLEGDDPR